MNRHIRTTLSIVAAFAAVMLVTATPVRAAEQSFAFTPSSSAHGPWMVTSLFVEGDWVLESHKHDQGLIAWSATNAATSMRRLYVHDGVSTRRLAEMPLGVWDRDAGNPFFHHVTGNYDVADGTVAWTMTDGSAVNDREIYRFTNGVVTKVTDNSFDDRHPIVGTGRIAWTAQPGQAYMLMVSDAFGTYQMDTYHVPNYAFSGKNLFWLNKLNNETWFRVFVNDGIVSTAIGQGDDRTIDTYFFTDGKGSAAWEYSTKQWSYDKRRVYVSMNGASVVEVLQRDVPPHVTYVQDFDAGTVAIIVHDFLTSLPKDHSVIMANPAVGEPVKELLYHYAKIRFTDNGYVRHETPANASMVQVFPNAGGTEFITLAPIIHERFDADGTAVAGALVGGGVALYGTDGARVVVTSHREARSLEVSNGDIAWIEGDAGKGVLKFAARGVTVATPAGPRTVTGTLMKVAGNPAVYLAASDGSRYTFPSETLFRSWYPSFSGVRTVAPATLSSMPLNGSVLYAPGSRLVRSATSPRVYAVGANGTLHWVQSAGLLEAYYGTNWQNRLDTVPDALLAGYRQGNSVLHYSDYRVVQTSVR